MAAQSGIPASNALWLTFIAAWRDEAQTKGSKVARTYHKAHQSLSACPIEFQHPCQTTQLAGIGPTIATKLEQDLERWCNENNQKMPERPTRSAPSKSSTSQKRTRILEDDSESSAADLERNEAGDEDATDPPWKKNKKGKADARTVPKKKAYIPQHRSGAYGLLVGLYACNSSYSTATQSKVSKSELIAAARPFSDSDYEQSSSSRSSAAVPMSSQHASTGSAAASARGFYTAWTSIKTLISKGYVVQTGNPARYSLSEEGFRVAATLAKDAGVEAAPEQEISASEGGNPTTANTEPPEDWSDGELEEQVGSVDLEPIMLPAGSYTIHLIVDNRERHRFGRRQDREPIAALLLEKGIDVEVRALEVGDAIWVARRLDSTESELDEVVLDFIVERKRLDDLVGSILDGRWRDQKFRLSSSGLSQILYLIEEHDVDNQMRKFGPQIQTALSSTQVVEGFLVEKTSSLSASIDYLAAMDAMVRASYQDQDLSIIPSRAISRPSFLKTKERLQAKSPKAAIVTSFEAFQALNSKSGGLTLEEIFGKMLLCIKGMSAEKAREVLAIWRTPADLMESYKQLDYNPGQAAQLLVDQIEVVEQRKKIGPALSQKASEVFVQSRYMLEQRN